MAGQKLSEARPMNVDELDAVVRRFRRMRHLVNLLILILAVSLAGRAWSPRVAMVVERSSIFVMLAGMVILTGVSQRLCRAQSDDLETMRFLSTRDALTRVYNLHYLSSRIDEEVLRSARHKHTFSLLFVDLDSFKRVNDDYGHGLGDRVLREVAAILDETCRLTDLVGRARGLVGRVGGDEFVVVLPETDVTGARVVAARFIEAIENLRIDSGNGTQIDFLGLSLGIAAYPRDADERKALIAEADAAMYRAKRAGGRCFVDSGGAGTPVGPGNTGSSPPAAVGWEEGPLPRRRAEEAVGGPRG